MVTRQWYVITFKMYMICIQHIMKENMLLLKDLSEPYRKFFLQIYDFSIKKCVYW